MTNIPEINAPGIEQRSEQPYVGVRERVTMRALATVVDRIPPIVTWLAERGLNPAGPPFLRYLIIDGAPAATVEAGVPVAAALPTGDDLFAAVLPAGRFATVTHVGPPDGLAAAVDGLLAWAAEQGLPLDRSDGPSGEHWGCRLEEYLTNPAEEPDPAGWRTRLALRLTG